MKELISEHQRFDHTETLFSLRKNGGYVYIRSSLGGSYMSVLVVRQAGRQNLVIYRIFTVQVRT